MDYVTDTHSLVWYFTDDSRLSINALKAFQTSETEGTVFVPAVVLAEIMFIARKGRITHSLLMLLKTKLMGGKLLNWL